jgi:hypothetical protein
MNDIAAMLYMVERIESDSLTTMRRVAWQAASPLGGIPLVRPVGPDPNRPLVMSEAQEQDVRRNARGDFVRIFDREGNVAWWREFTSRDAGIRVHSEIMDDLMKLDPAAFRRKYAIIPERPPGVAAPGPTEPGPTEAGAPGNPGAGTAVPEEDPLGAWRERLQESEGGSEWKAPEPARPSDPDILWDDWGQR